MKRIELTFTLCLFTLLSFGQDFLNKNPMSISEEITQAKINTVISNHQIEFSPSDISLLKDQIREYNKEIDNKVACLITERQNLSDARNKLIQLESASKIPEQIEAIDKSYKNIETEISKNLEGFVDKAFYIYVEKGINSYEDPNKLMEKAKQSITPHAIYSTRGSFISSVSDLHKKENIDDKLYRRITETKSGQVSGEQKYGSGKNNAHKVFWYACQLSVAPLKSKLNTNPNKPSTKNSNILIINALKNNNISKSLVDFGIPEHIIADIEDVVIQNKESVELQNFGVNQRKKTIIRNGNEKLSDLKLQKLNLERKMRKAYKIVNQIVSEYTTNIFDPSKLKNSINETKNDLNNIIEQNLKKEIHWRSKKLRAEFDVNVSTMGSPIEALAKETLQAKKQFETNYGKIEQYIEEKELNNASFDKHELRNIIHNLKVNKMWLYPDPIENGWNLCFVASFRVLEKPYESLKHSFTDQNLNTPPQDRYSPDILMILVDGGEFEMGCDTNKYFDCGSDELPQHFISVPDFRISQYEITFNQYLKFMNDVDLTPDGKLNNTSVYSSMGKNIKYNPNGEFVFHSDSVVVNENCPIINVSWHAANEYCMWLSKKTGKKYRLPTEAEWEYAARGGKMSKNFKYAGSNTIDKIAVYEGNNNIGTRPVGENRLPNELDVYDMSGNVWEWCNDWYNEYESAYQIHKEEKVLRGGGWSSLDKSCRIFNRSKNKPDASNSRYGFRIVSTSF